MFPQYWPENGWIARSDWYASFARTAKKDPTLLTGRQELPGGRRGAVSIQDPRSYRALIDTSAAADEIWCEAAMGAGVAKFCDLAPNSPWFIAISTYINQTITVAPYNGSRYEAARMWKALTSGGFSGLKQAIKDDRDHLLQVRAPGDITVNRIQICKNPDRWAKYVAHRTSIASQLGLREEPLKNVKWTYKKAVPVEGMPFEIPVLTPNLGECLLFHGTSEFVAQLISHGGFRPDLCTSRGIFGGYGALGKGTYLSDAFAKIATYCACPMCKKTINCNCLLEDNTKPQRIAFLSRALIGNLYVTTKKDRTQESNLPQNQTKPVVGARGTVVGQYQVDGVLGLNKRDARGSKFNNNEFLIGSAAAMYPEFLIYFNFN